MPRNVSSPTLPTLGAPEAPTPVMAQYLAAKAQHPDCLLFFRLGDFYELFFDDALKAARALDIALTHRGRFQGQDVPMCGVPFHAYENYLARLIRQGFRVALCEQTESPVASGDRKGSKGLIAREVVRVVTPGTVTEDSLLEAGASNPLACVTRVEGAYGLAWCDLAEGVPRLETLNVRDLAAALARVAPCEILTSSRLVDDPESASVLAAWKDQLVPLPPGRFNPDSAREIAQKTYNVRDLGAFGTFTPAEVTALGALLDYLALTQKTTRVPLAVPRRAEEGGFLSLDPATRRNLEITRTLSGERAGSLLAAVDRTCTGAGARLLATRLSAPLVDERVIAERLEAIAFFVDRSELRAKVREHLRATPDLERALARLALKRGGPRDLASVREALRHAESLRGLWLEATSPAHPGPSELDEAAALFGALGEWSDRLTQALTEPLPLLARDGGFIARGYAPHLDEWVTLRDEGRRLIAGLQQKYVAQTGVANLKIKHNAIIGFHIEVPAGQADKLGTEPETFIHRQTLAGAARFTTNALMDLERRSAEASGKALATEIQIFEDLAQGLMHRLEDLRTLAAGLAVWDVTAGLAELAQVQRYARPTVDRTATLRIVKGRHPVVEQALRSQGGAAFVGNGCDLSPEGRLGLLTGPNMAGKSTFLRQNALIVLLAQMGSFVPAVSAHIGLVDRLFSRVGAADDLARGQSTFMVEMLETAAILNQATPRSFVILDEIGRGTATYDGLSLAWATVEHLHNVLQCRALFATHYHELTALAGSLPALFCATLRVREWEGGIVFTHEVIAGVADRSYGLHVARMAGLPEPVLDRAAHVLADLEAKARDSGFTVSGATVPTHESSQTHSPTPEPWAALKALLEATDPDALTPRDALALLYQLKTAARAGSA